MTAAEQALEDGRPPKLLEVIEIPLARRSAKPGQPENWRIAPGSWQRVRQLGSDATEDLLTALTSSAPLLGNRGKAVHVDDFSSLESSLAVANPHDIVWQKTEAEKLYGQFMHAGREVRLPVTDLAWKELFEGDPPGEYEVTPDGEIFVVVSVTAAPLNNFHSKLIAGVVHLV